EGERMPNRPDATGTLHGIRLGTSTPEHLARAYVEGMLCGLADGLDALRALGVTVERVQLIGGGAQSEAVRRIAPQVLGLPVTVPEPGEYVADGAARQAAWVLAAHAARSAGADPGDVAPPTWAASSATVVEDDPVLAIRERYAAVRDLVWPAPPRAASESLGRGSRVRGAGGAQPPPAKPVWRHASYTAIDAALVRLSERRPGSMGI